MENERAKSRLSKKKIEAKDHDAKRKMDVARLGGKDRRTGDAKAHLENQIHRTEDARDSIQKSLKRKEGFSIESSDFCKAIVIEETDLTVGKSKNELGENSTYTLHIPRLEIVPGNFSGKFFQPYTGLEVNQRAYKSHGYYKRSCPGKCAFLSFVFAVCCQP